MQISVETLSKVKKKINIKIPADRVAREIDNVYENIRKHAAVKGFRKGKVPRAFIEKHYNEKMEDDVLKNLVNETYFSALKDHEIFPVSHPVIDSDTLKKGEPFSYTATVEVFPDVEVKDYTGLEAKKEKFAKNDGAIDQRLKEMQENMAQLQPLSESRPVSNGDFVIMDFKGYIDGTPFDQGSAEDFTLEIGSGRFIPGFEDQIVGMQVGEESEIKVTFPENYGNEELNGREAVFKVEVKEIKVKEYPPLDDDFAKEFGEFETLDQLRGKLEEMYEKQERARIESDFRERLIRTLIEKNDIEIPESMIDRQLDIMLDNTKKRLAYQKLSLEMMGLDEKGYRVQFRNVAESQVKGSLLLEQLAKQEGIVAEEADIENEIKKIADENNQEFDRIQGYYQQNPQVRENLAAQVREDKVIEFLTGKASIVEVPAEEIQK